MPVLRKHDDWYKLVSEIRNIDVDSNIAFWNYSGDRLTRSQVTKLLLSGPDKWNAFKYKQKHRLIWYHVNKDMFWIPGYIINLRSSNFRKADLSHRDLSAVDFTNSDFRRADFSYSSIGTTSGVGLTTHTSLVDCNCQHAKFVVTRFDGARASGTDFSFSEFNGATVNRTNFQNAKFNKALFAASVTNTNLSGADFSGCYVAGSDFSNTKISVAKNLHKAKFGDHCQIDYKTMQLSTPIPRGLLKACGVAPNHIKYIDQISKSLPRLPTCFMSYSDIDRKFVDRLTRELESKGIRIWLAPRDLPFGAPTRDDLEMEIEKNDKLIVVLSKSSLKSQWVQFEVETAFEIERKKRIYKIIPIMIDEQIFKTRASWARHLVRTRNIADYRKWRKTDTSTVEDFIRRLQSNKRFKN